jgi:serine/threonine-protein kinase HipA
MASRQLDVWMHDTLVGTITNFGGDQNIFSFDEAYRHDPAAPVISFKAFRHPVTGEYLAEMRHTTRRVHPYFANLLPEGSLRRYLAQHADVSQDRDFPLLWLLGADLPGGLVIRDHAGDPSPPVESGTRAPAAGPAPNVLRFSLAGVQLKFSASGNPTRGFTIPVSGLDGHWILKLPDQRYQDVPANEFAMMSFARAVGIDVPEIGLVDPAEVEGLPADVRNLTGVAYYIRRFDRKPDGGRVHTEDFAQANGIYPDDKYDRLSFDQIAEQVATYASLDDAIEFVRRLTFNLVIGNGDMHAKNWSMMYRDPQRPQLAPPYDYLSTVVYMPGDGTGLNIAGTKRFADIDEARLTALSKRAGLPKKIVLDAAADMVASMHEVWPKIAGDLPIREAHRKAIEEHMDTVPIYRK